jgi:hypothetical protein
MSEYVKIKNTDLVRDLKTKAVLNTDNQSVKEFDRQRQKILREKQQNADTKQRLEQLEQSMNEIKLLLMELKTLKDQK